MELEFEIREDHPMTLGAVRCKTFNKDGGVIGRASDCDWVIDTPAVSNHHLQVSFRNGEFYLTDLSTNGSYAIDDQVQLAKGRPHRIRQGTGYRLADIEIRAHLSGVLPLDGHVSGLARSADSLQPFAESVPVDPLLVVKQPTAMAAELSALINVAPRLQTADRAPLQHEHLIVPTLVAAQERVAPAPLPQAPAETFWRRMGDILGIDMQPLPEAEREALAISAAALLKQCVDGLQQSLRTRDEIKRELRVSVAADQDAPGSPLTDAADAGSTLAALLQNPTPKQLPAGAGLAQGFRELQTHQVAMLAASRAALNGALAHLAPQRMRLSFERDRRYSLFNTDGSRWRAYQRHHQTLSLGGEWSEHLLARDFAQTYQEQVRLIATLHADYQG